MLILQEDANQILHIIPIPSVLKKHQNEAYQMKELMLKVITMAQTSINLT